MSIENCQYIEKIPRANYFVGFVTFKMRGELDKDTQSNEGSEFFRKLKCYAVKISVPEKITDDYRISTSKSDISQSGKIDASAYRKLEKAYQLDSMVNSAVVNFKGNDFICSPTEIWLLKSSIPSMRKHTMVDGNELHSYFEAQVCFILTDLEDKTFCKEGYPTGKSEQKEDSDGIRFERTEHYTKTCSTYWGDWRPIDNICIQDEPTGRKETNLDMCSERFEYKNRNCTTYWGDWQKLNNIKGTLTGNRKHENGVLWLEYSDENCKTYWEPQITGTGDDRGCLYQLLSLLGWLLLISLILLFAIPLITSIANHFSFWIIPILAILLIYLFSLSRTVRFIFSWLFNLLFYGFLISLISFIGYSIYSWWNNDIVKTEWTMPDSEENEKEEIKVEESNESNTEITSDSLIYHTRSWYDYDLNKYQGTYSIRYSDVTTSSNNISALSEYSTTQTIYNSVFNYDKNKLPMVYQMLDSIREANNMVDNGKPFAELIVSFVQDIDYVAVIDLACDSPNLPQEVRSMINSGIDCDGFIPFGLKTPVNFMADLKGDCDSRTLLIYTIFKHFNYDVAIINSNEYIHSMIGISLNYQGAYKLYNGKKYFFWETTAKGYEPGILPKEFGNTNYWYISLN